METAAEGFSKAQDELTRGRGAVPKWTAGTILAVEGDFLEVAFDNGVTRWCTSEGIAKYGRPEQVSA